MDCISITKGPELLPFQRGMFKCVEHVFLQYLNDIIFFSFSDLSWRYQVRKHASNQLGLVTINRFCLFQTCTFARR